MRMIFRRAPLSLISFSTSSSGNASCAKRSRVTPEGRQVIAILPARILRLEPVTAEGKQECGLRLALKELPGGNQSIANGFRGRFARRDQPGHITLAF